MTAPIVHGGGITAAASVYGGAPQDWLDLSTGINPCPVTLPQIDPRVWHRLPDQSLVEDARAAAATYYRSTGILPLPVPGTQSVIQMLPRLVSAGRPVAILSPTYGEYARAFQVAGIAVDAVAGLDDIRPDHGLVVIVNPNNPTGRAFSPQTLHALWERLSAHGTVMVVDEAFGDGENTGSLAPLAASMPGLIILRSFGKFFGLAGLRLGFVISTPDRLRQFEAWLGPWAVSGPALAMSAILLRQDAMPIRARISDRKAALDGVLDAAGLKPAGGTLLFSLVVHRQAQRLHSGLCQHHILVRKFDYEPTWLRVGLAPDTAGDMRLARALATLEI